MFIVFIIIVICLYMLSRLWVKARKEDNPKMVKLLEDIGATLIIVFVLIEMNLLAMIVIGMVNGQ